MAKKERGRTAKQNKAAPPLPGRAPFVIEIGKFIGNPRGFGFITPSDGGADIFIPPHLTLGALNGDTVEYKIAKDDGSPMATDPDKPSRTGKVKAIISRASMVGIFHIMGTQGFVRPSETKVPYTFSVPPKIITKLGLADGHVVMFTVDKHTDPDRGAKPCFITEIIGHMHDPGVDVLSLVRQANVPIEFSEKVMTQVTATPDMVSSDEIQGRLDLREELIFTIDGDDTKDIDDAISFAQTPDGNYKLGVHIADVTHYVQEHSALDASALERGTSIYLADRVIPMLPHKLSSGICSLFPDVDRLTLSCIMTVNPQGHVVSYEIAKSVINSKKRWTYNGVQDVLDSGAIHNDDVSVDWPQIFAQMDNLRETLRKKRESKGALDFNLPEAKIRVDESGKPISIEPYNRTNSTGIIEEFMILCNETIATHFLALGENTVSPHSEGSRIEFPFVYRTHEAPSAEKMAKLGTLAKNLGIKSPKSASSPMVLQRLLASSAKTAAAQSIATAVLHSLPQARYTPDNPTHYGLASEAYCHFTSPIRRYADLQIHRITKAWLSAAPLDCFHEILPEVCAQCSHTERTAEALEREVEQLKKVQFMQGWEGQTFEAIISGVTAWGIYVMLQNTIEGIIPFESLRRRQFTFDKEKSVYIHKSHKSKKKKKPGNKPEVLRHGAPLTVRLKSALEDERKLVFSME